MHSPGGGAPRGSQRFMSPKMKPKNTQATLKRLWEYVRHERLRLLFIMSLVIFSAILTLIVPLLLGRSVDSLTIIGGSVSFSMLFNTLLILLMIYGTDTVLNLVQGTIVAGVSQRMVKKLREALFIKLQSLPIKYFDAHPHGEIMSRLTNDIDNVSTTVSQSAASLISGSFTLMGAFLMMVALSPLLTAAALITVPLVYFLTRFVAKNTSKLFREQQRALGALNGRIEEAVSGIDAVRLYNREEQMIAEFDAENEVLRRVGLRAQVFSGFLMPLMNVISNLGFSMVATVGGFLATRDVISIGIIASFLTYSRQFSRPLNDLANIFNTLQSAIAGAERVFEVMDEEEEADDCQGCLVAGSLKGQVEFREVSFSYEKGQDILKTISFRADPGMTIALVGPTGAGKTTIASLLTRFYDVTSGEIRIDGNDIRNYSRNSLRKNFGMVLQDTYLFAGTIMENLKYGNLLAADSEVIASSRLACAHSFIKRLPNGYETILVEGGGNISQGQRQLLAITRAILANPSILILDEATSNIDTRTEARIQKALMELMKGRTSFVIAHRLSTIREADLIIVVDNGQIIEMGNHDKLYALGGFYAEMLKNQLESMKSDSNKN